MTAIPANVDVSALGIYNVKAYGAVGDGVTDDTVAIQKAINSAYQAGGGIVYLPDSKYLIDGGPFTRGTKPGSLNGVFPGMTPIPINPVTHAAYVLESMVGPNNGAPLPNGVPTMLPNGPLLLFDNVVLAGNGPEQTVLLAGPNLYGGWVVSPNGTVQSGAVIATANWWTPYGNGLPDFPDGFFVHKAIVRSLSIDCQGRLGTNAGLPSHLFLSGGISVPNPKVQKAADNVTPIGQLSDAAIRLHAAQNAAVERVWVYDGNVDGIAIDGTQDSDAQTNGPLPQSFNQSVTNGRTFSPNTPSAPNPTGILPAHNSPLINAGVTDCQVDLNWPVWLAGSPAATGGSNGRTAIQATGCGAISVLRNFGGQRNQPSAFPTPPTGYTNPPTLAPNSGAGINVVGAWHLQVFGNILTCCEGGIVGDGNGDVVVTENVLYNFAGAGILFTALTGKAVSQGSIFGNTVFLGSDFATSQDGIAVIDAIPAMPTPANEAATATPGSLSIAANMVYGCAYDTMLRLKVIGATVSGNVFDFAGVQPQNQPNPASKQNNSSSPVWPTPNGSGVSIEGNDIIVSGNVFRNAAGAGMPNPNAVGISFPADFPPSVTPDSIRVLVTENIFDKTIGVPVQNGSSGTNGLLGVRMLDNIGINPAGAVSASLVPFPLPGATFANPYPYDCWVTIAAGVGADVSGVTLYGVATGAKIPANAQKSFLVKAGGTIAVTYPPPPAPRPTWVWVGM